MWVKKKLGKLLRKTDSVRSKCSGWPSLATKAFNNCDTLAYTCAVYRKQRPSHNPLVLIAEMTRSREKYLVSIYAFAHITATYRRKKAANCTGFYLVPFINVTLIVNLVKDDETRVAFSFPTRQRVAFPE